MMKTICFLIFALVCRIGVTQAQMKALSGRTITTAAMDRFVRQQMDSLKIPGMSIAVINGGRIVYHRVLGLANTTTKEKVDSQSIFEACSLSKTVFTYFVMRLVEKGELSLDTPLYRYMPYRDIAYDERYKLITARMVLSHTSGLPNWRWVDKVDSSRHIKYGDLYLNFTPGTRFGYSGEGYHYLAQVLAFLNNKTLNTLEPLYEKEVAVPLGMKHSYFAQTRWIVEHKVIGYGDDGKFIYNPWPSGFFNPDPLDFGGADDLHSDAMDYGAFLCALLNGKGLAKESITEMLRPQVRVPADNNEYLEDGVTAWGLGIALRPTPYGQVYLHTGNNPGTTSGFMIDMTRKIGFVFFLNCEKGDVFQQTLREYLTEGQR